MNTGSTGARATDVIVVGAGILGLAHAWHAARRGKKVVLFDRSPRAFGASIRNFGMVWPVGQPVGEKRDLALRSRDLWLELLGAGGIWHDAKGSLHVARGKDELAVLEELSALINDGTTRMLTASEALAKSPWLVADGLLGALESDSEVCVDSPVAIAALPGFLRERHGVDVRFNHAVTHVADGTVVARGETWRAERVFVCTGDEQTLFPALYADSGLVRCKLQMLATEGITTGRMGPMLAAGLTLAHYGAFRDCKSLPAARARLEREHPEHFRWGVHVLVSQNSRGELILGDSHEYGDVASPFNRVEIDDLVLGYLRTFFTSPTPRIERRWQGVYVKHPEKSWFVASPDAATRVVTGVGGAGMTLSFGLAERMVAEHLG